MRKIDISVLLLWAKFLSECTKLLYFYNRLHTFQPEFVIANPRYSSLEKGYIYIYMYIYIYIYIYIMYIYVFLYIYTLIIAAQISCICFWENDWFFSHFLSYLSIKLCHKNKGEFWPQVPFNRQYFYKFAILNLHKW